MSTVNATLFTTVRLSVRQATVADAALLYALWTDPRVMTFVGFPQGLRISQAAIEAQLAHPEEAQTRRLLIAQLATTGQAIGQLKLAMPDAQGIAEPDIKLLPQVWGLGYGQELWPALINYQFQQTDCQLVQATPNVANQASIRLQEAAGLQRVGEAVYEFPATMRDYTSPVRHYIYQLHRSDWLAQSSESM